MINPEVVARNWLSKSLQDTDVFDQFVYAWFAFNALYSENMTDQNRELDAILTTVQNQVWSIEPRKLSALMSSGAVRFFETRIIRDMRKPERDTSFSHKRLANRNNNDRIRAEALFRILYTVRCNLFHGNKNFADDSDTAVIRNAAEIMKGYLSGVVRL